MYNESVRESLGSIVQTEEVIGVNVKNTKGENLGEIEEIMLDKVNGNVHYVVLSFGGFLGMGDKLFALPWKILHYDKEQECFIINVEKENLKNAPGFSRDNWPDTSDRMWEESIFDFYGEKPYWHDRN